MGPIEDFYISPNKKIYNHTEIDTDSIQVGWTPGIKVLVSN